MPDYNLMNMCRRAGYFPGYGMHAAMMMPTYGYGGGGGMNASIARVCYRAGYYEMTRGHGRGGYDRYARHFAQSVQQGWPTFAKAEGAGKDRGTGDKTPAKGAGGAGGAAPAQAKPKADGAEKKDTPEEAEKKADEKEKKRRVKAAESKIAKLKANAATKLHEKKGYSPEEAKEVAKIVKESVDTNHGGDPDKAEAAAERYASLLNTVPHKKNDTNGQPYKEGVGNGSWSKAYTKWLAGMKKIQPPARALHAVGDVKRVGRKKGSFAKGTPSHAVLERVGIRQDKAGNVYDAFEVTKSAGSRVPPSGSIIVRRKGKWYVYNETTHEVTRLKAGRRNPKYDPKLGILNMDKRGRKLVIKMRDGLNAKAINDNVTDWMKQRPKVMSEEQIGKERAQKVKKAIETKLEKYFGKKLVTVTTDGRDVKIEVKGSSNKERNENARAVAAALEGNQSYFRAVFDDMVPGASFVIGSDHRVAARDKATFNRVVGALRKLPTETKVATLDVRRFNGILDEPPTFDDMKARVDAYLPKAVAGTKVVVTLRFIEGNAPKANSKRWKRIVKLIKAKYAKKGRTVEVKQVTVKETAEAAYTDDRDKLENHAKAALWDGTRRGKRGEARAVRDATRMVDNAERGATKKTAKKRRNLVPLPVAEFRRSLDRRLRAHADRMRARLLEAKRKHGLGSKRFKAALAAYNKWYALAKTYLGKMGKGVAEYYDPAKVKDENSRGRVVTKRRPSGNGHRGPPNPGGGGLGSP